MPRILLLILLLVISCDETVAPDTTAPTVAITYPANGSTLTATDTIRVDVADESEISSVKFLIDGTEAYADSSAPYEYVWDVCVQGTNNHTVLVKAEDSTGNQGQSDVNTYTINASYDCASVCGGTSVLSGCDNACNSTLVVDCAEECGGNATTDNCGTCDGDSSNDCVQDDCDVWGGDNSPNTGTCDCNGTPDGTTAVDECGTCGGNGISDGIGYTSAGYSCNDLKVLQDFIDLNPELPISDAWEFKNILNWSGGRLTEFTFPSQNIYRFVNIIPESIGNLESLTRLEIGGQPFSSLPESIGNLTNLTELWLTINQLTSIPESIGNLTNLTRLELAWNKLTTLPDGIWNLNSLKQMSLSDNLLASIPESIGNLSSLERLDLSNNLLTSIPESIGNLSSLEHLSIHYNLLTSLPESIGNLSSLTLYGWNNLLTSLPVGICNIHSFSLGYNQICGELPSCLIEIWNVYLETQNCP